MPLLMSARCSAFTFGLNKSECVRGVPLNDELVNTVKDKCFKFQLLHCVYDTQDDFFVEYIDNKHASLVFIGPFGLNMDIATTGLFDSCTYFPLPQYFNELFHFASKYDPVLFLALKRCIDLSLSVHHSVLPSTRK